MSYQEAREHVIKRIQKELIGPGSDVYFSENNNLDEVIEGKPLMRYFSGIVFPPRYVKRDDDIKQENDDDASSNEIPNAEETISTDAIQEKLPFDEGDEETSLQIKPNQYYPSIIGLTFCVPTDLAFVDFTFSFGTYDKAKPESILIPYDGLDIDFIKQYSLENYIEFDSSRKILKLLKALPSKSKKQEAQVVTERDVILSNINSLKKDFKNHPLTSHIDKILGQKDKYIRTDHSLHFAKLEVCNLFGKKISEFAEFEDLDLPYNLSDHIYIHQKYYDENGKRYFKILIENKAFNNDKPFDERTFVLSKEALNKRCLFQVELNVKSERLLQYNREVLNEYLSDEDKNLNFLYRKIKSYGIGHGAACTWDMENKEPQWIKTTFVPQFDSKNLSTEQKDLKGFLNIKNLSSFSDKTKTSIISDLEAFIKYYQEWIINKYVENKGHEIGINNLQKCDAVLKRIENGIKILSSNDLALKAFLHANSAIYMQMFHTAKYFDRNRGYEKYEWNFGPLPTLADYRKIEYPNDKLPIWRPFQLAFFLLSISSIVEPQNTEERELVDLIWFPTGGGKTEAYLAVSAFLIFYRRLTNPSQYGGVNIIMRYTLRLLTAQQFERASKLILACEKIRKSNEKELGTERISIGFWVGDSTTPNNLKNANDSYNKILERLNEGKKRTNIFQVNTCQWCNTKIITKDSPNDKVYKYGVRENIKISCNNPDCDYHYLKDDFPIFVIDELIYKNPPTILFATVDKFAQLAWREEGRNLFNRHTNNLPPELIIQDELHLLSGPLGSITGLFENIIIELCSKNNIKPKIITSTATVKNVAKQILGLYNREVSIFPPFGIDYDDSFFAKINNDSKRKYVGILPTGKTATMAQLRLLSVLLYARIELWKNPILKGFCDPFWTILSYYNSLKDVGKTANKINPELKPELKQLQHRHLVNIPDNFERLSYRNRELTSRVPSNKIKENLDELTFAFEGNINDTKALDLVLATNMISVGLDISRLGIMIINSMPRNTAEYIQSSSRVARKNEGIALSLLNPESSRDLSVFEHFIPFHQTFYKQVEPLSVTPFTENALNKMLFTVLVTFYRHSIGNFKNESAKSLDKEQLKKEFIESIKGHKFIDSKIDYIERKVDELLVTWEERIHNTPDLVFSNKNKPEVSLLKDSQNKTDEGLITMQSMRNVEPVCSIKINQY